MHTGTPVRFTSYPATTRMRRSRSNVFHQRVKVPTPQISKHSLPLHTRKVAGSIQPDDQLFRRSQRWPLFWAADHPTSRFIAESQPQPPPNDRRDAPRPAAGCVDIRHRRDGGGHRRGYSAPICQPPTPPKLQCESGRPGLGSSRPILRTPASAGHSAQSSTGRDNDDCPVRVKVAEFGVSLRGWLRSSEIGCGFEDAGPVRPEDCFPVPSLSVVRGGASASPAGREFEIAYVDAESGARRLVLIDAWSVPFEECMPVRGFPSYKGQRNHVGRWWTATTGSLVGYESWLERLLDFDPDVVGIAAQPFWLLWTTPEGKPCSHAPDYFARSAGGAALVMDCRPADRIKPRDAVCCCPAGWCCCCGTWRLR